MTVRSIRKIRRALQKKGFHLHEGGNHEKYVLHNQDGKETVIFTVLSQGSRPREYDDRLLSRMAQQLKLSKDKLLDLLDCRLDHEKYLALLRQKGVL